MIYFTIKDMKHKLYLAAGEKQDGNVYHQGSPERDVTKWCFEPVESGPAADPSTIYYRIKDKKHNLYLVAGDKANNNVYHQNHGNRKNALWSITPEPIQSGYGGHVGFKIEDAAHRLCLTAGCKADNHVYHQADSSPAAPERRWILEPVGEVSNHVEDYPEFYRDLFRVYFTIKDVKHQLYLAAGETADNHVYHQGSPERDVTKWCFELVEPGPMDDPNITYYRIKDKKHNLYLAAGDTADNNVYHQSNGNRKNAIWTITLGQTQSGHGGFKIEDALHHCCLTAGCKADNHVYHQPDSNPVAPERRWIIEPAGEVTHVDDYPDFFVVPSKCIIQKVEILKENQSPEMEEPDALLSATLYNKSQSQQTLVFAQEVTKTSEDHITTTTTCSTEVAVGISAKISFPFDLGEVGISMDTTNTHTRENSKSFSTIDTTTYSINNSVNVSPNSKMEATVTIKRQMKNVNFKATVLYYLANGKTETKEIHGQWSGVMVTNCNTKYQETPISIEEQKE